MSDVFIPVFGSTDELLLHLLQDFFQGQDIHIGTLFSEEIDPPMIGSCSLSSSRLAPLPPGWMPMR